MNYLKTSVGSPMCSEKLQSDTVIKFQGGSTCQHGPKDPDEPLSQKPEFRSYQGPLSYDNLKNIVTCKRET